MRDIFRWCDLLSSRLQYLSQELNILFKDELQFIHYLIADTAYSLFISRMRSSDDRNQIKNVFLKVFEFPIEVNLLPRIDFFIEFKPQLIELVCNICVG